MKCPFCDAIDTLVVDSRASESGDSIRRRRQCPECSRRFTTYETADVRMPQVVKHNGKREEYSLEKIRQGFKIALHKRPVSSDLVDEAIKRLNQRILNQGEREIESLRIGEMVMEELRRLDKVAYVRFASVYRSFQDPDDFREVIRDL